MATPPYVPCPRCGNNQPQKVSFTWWGGMLGPKLFSHVKCPQCQYTYNGKTGKPNSTAIAIYLVVGVLIGILAVVLIIAAL